VENNSDYRAVLDENAIPTTTAYRWQLLARLPEEEFESQIEESNRPITTSYFVAQAKKAERENQTREAIERMDGQSHDYGGEFETNRLYLADVTTDSFLNSIPENAVDLIVTDPPWDRDSLATYRAAARIAMKTLRPGHFMAIYAGKMFLPEILDLLRDSGLVYVWQFCVYQPDSNDRINKYNLYSTHRPVFLMQKPGHRAEMIWIPDSVKSTRDKQYHKWGQGIELPEKLITAYTKPYEIVLDPFIGGASVPVAAKRNGRQYIGFDISKEAIQVGLERLGEASIQE
jgi:hypothetical protein